MEDVREKLQAALKTAMQNKDAMRRDTLRMAMSALKQVEIDERRTLSPEDALAILQKEVKKRRESIEEARKAGREDIAGEEEVQLRVLEDFMPRQLTRDEIAAIVDEVIAQTGVTTQKEMGKLMGVLMARVRGLADGRLVNDVVREKLG